MSTGEEGFLAIAEKPACSSTPTEAAPIQWTERASEKKRGERTEVSSGKMTTPDRRFRWTYLQGGRMRGREGGREGG